MGRLPVCGWRDACGVRVRNETMAIDIAPADGLIAVTLRDRDGGESVRHARKLVLATGQEGTGDWWMPDFVAALPRHLRAKASDTIDFTALRARHVAVLGAGASAFDNAATALEAGAASVELYCRRPEPQTIQPYRWLTFAGFPAPFVGFGRCVAMAFHEPHPGNARRFSASDVRSLREAPEFPTGGRPAMDGCAHTARGAGWRWRRRAAPSAPIS